MAAQQVGAHGAQEPEALCDELRAALQAVGITLPSVRVDPVSWNGGAFGYALIDLGRCNLRTARRLVEVLQAEA